MNECVVCVCVCVCVCVIREMAAEEYTVYYEDKMTRR